VELASVSPTVDSLLSLPSVITPNNTSGVQKDTIVPTDSQKNTKSGSPKRNLPLIVKLSTKKQQKHQKKEGEKVANKPIAFTGSWSKLNGMLPLVATTKTEEDIWIEEATKCLSEYGLVVLAVPKADLQTVTLPNFIHSPGPSDTDVSPEEGTKMSKEHTLAQDWAHKLKLVNCRRSEVRFEHSLSNDTDTTESKQKIDTEQFGRNFLCTGLLQLSSYEDNLLDEFLSTFWRSLLKKSITSEIMIQRVTKKKRNNPVTFERIKTRSQLLLNVPVQYDSEKKSWHHSDTDHRQLGVFHIESSLPCITIAQTGKQLCQLVEYQKYKPSSAKEDEYFALAFSLWHSLTYFDVASSSSVAQFLDISKLGFPTYLDWLKRKEGNITALPFPKPTTLSEEVERFAPYCLQLPAMDNLPPSVLVFLFAIDVPFCHVIPKDDLLTPTGFSLWRPEGSSVSYSADTNYPLIEMFSNWGTEGEVPPPQEDEQKGTSV